ncbi:MAG: NAD regulator [Pseudomonadota bacterium]
MTPSGRAIPRTTVEIGLTAAIVSVEQDEPKVLVIRHAPEGDDDAIDMLPYGPFSPRSHRTLEAGLRSWVQDQTALKLGYAEQLYTFGDRGRYAEGGDISPHVVSIGYLALTRAASDDAVANASWRSWYDFFPWEDWRRGAPDVIATEIVPHLQRWVASADGASPKRQERVNICFGQEGAAWDEEKVLERYELLYEAGLVDEAARDGRTMSETTSDEAPVRPRLGLPMRHDHRRILATAISRLRAKIKYRPVVFELMSDDFTLFELQKSVEAILGPHLHKQNFRRLVESAGLVEPTGDMKTRTGGRPARLYRFRREVVMERPAPGVRVKPGRVA